MSRYWNPGRRRFIEAAGAAAAAVPIISCSGPKSPWRYLNPAEAATLEAVCEQLIPSDEFAGAAWAGAVRYIDLQLYGHFRELRTAYREGLAQLDRTSRSSHQRAFADLTAGEQTALLTAVEAGKAPGWNPEDQRRFFRLVLSHTMQSYYGDPRHGGNREEVGYRSIGLTTTPTRGRSKHSIQPVTPPGDK